MTTRTSSVEVAIRIRPLRAELNEVASKWDVRKNSLTEIGSENDFTFTFDRVYDPSTSTEDVYASSVKDSIVRNVVQGFNGTVFAYGQTGSGKSHTMLGDKAGNGISGMALRDLFEGLKKEQQQGKVVKVYLEMIEIYNEQLRDLMVKKDGPLATLSIRENEHGVYVHNAIRQEVSSAQNCLDCMEAEAKNRVVAATKMNEQSSRSHCLIRIIVEKTQSFDDSGSDDDDPNMTPVSRRKLEKKIVSSLNLVDLAGSERVSKTGATGVRMVEGGHINKSLACLTTVINKLSEPAKKGQSVHIPFRDSKLTYLLKTALGGNSYTTVFCCITPAAQHADESRSTLFFAQRAKAIKNEIQLNEVVDNRTKIRELELLVKKYKAMLVATDLYLWAKEIMLRKAREESTDSASAAATAAANEHVSRLESLVEQLTHENETLKEEAQHNVFLGVAGGGAGSSGAGGHTDPMYGLLGFADGEQVARLKSELAEMERTLTEALQDKSTLIESVADLEEICEGLGRENEEKDARLNDLKVKLRDVEHENMLLRNELDAKLQQLEQAQAQKQQQQQALMERARGDGLLEQLTQLQVAHQTLELEHSTLIELYSKAEIESAAALKVIEEERDELAAKIASSRNETIETNAFLWRLVSLGHLAAQGTPIERDEIKIQQPVKPARVDQALKSLELFVASRSNRPPALSELGATPQRSAVSTDAAGQPPAQGPSGGDEALLARIKELESQMQLNEARRDIVIDTKLKRMQELVLRLHTTNSHVMQDLHTLCRENDALHALIRRESKLAKIAEKEGLLPANEALLKNRALNTRLPEPPFFHN